MLNLQKKGDPANWERGNPAWRLTWKSPRIRINWWKRQRWIMSAMQRGIILSKHGSPANTRAYTHMVWGLDKSIETLFSGYRRAPFWAERRERRFKLVDHRVHLSSLRIEQLDKSNFYLHVATACVLFDFIQHFIMKNNFKANFTSPTVQRMLPLEVSRCLDNLDAGKFNKVEWISFTSAGVLFKSTT